MIRADRVAGPVVHEFRKIQQEFGDEAAFDYLDAEADGLHVTPYGFCINSFTVDPCPKHIAPGHPTWLPSVSGRPRPVSISRRQVGHYRSRPSEDDSAEMTQKQDLTQFEEAFAAMLSENANITATVASKHSLSPYKHASDITRNAARSALLKQYVEKQVKLRRVMEQANKQSKTNLTIRIADLEHKNTQLQAQCDLLIASHKAMILAVGEMGGMAAWGRFFTRWPEGMSSLKEMGALPIADVLPLSPGGRGKRKISD